MSEYETPASVMLKNLVESPYYRLLSSQLDERQRSLVAQLLGDNTEFLVSGIASLLEVPKARPRGNVDLPSHPRRVTLEVEVACIIRDHRLGYLSLLEIGISTNRARIIDAIPWTSISKVSQLNNRIISFNKSEDAVMSLSFSFESEATTFYRALKLANSKPESHQAASHHPIELPTVKSEVDLPSKKLKAPKRKYIYGIIRRIFTKSKKSDKKTEWVYRKSVDPADSDTVIRAASDTIALETDNKREEGPDLNEAIARLEQGEYLRRAAEAIQKDEEMRAMRERVAELEKAAENEKKRAEEAERKEQIAIQNERKRAEEADRKDEEERERRARQEQEKKKNSSEMCNFCGNAVATVSFTCGHRSCKACSVVSIKSPVGFQCDAEICRECTMSVAKSVTNFFSSLGIS